MSKTSDFYYGRQGGRIVEWTPQPNAKPSRSWSEKIPCNGGPVTCLAVHHYGPELRIPDTMPMPGHGTYRYDGQHYQWEPVAG